MRLIDADALKEKHEKAEGGFYYVGGNRFMKRFEEMPTVDAVPVVRCEDCKYSEWTSRLDGTKVGYCRRIGNFISPDFYCFMKRFEEMPTVGAVPVVRCEDCKYSEWTSRLDGTKVGYCGRIGNFISPDFYCADGKGKEKTEARREHV